MHLVISIKTPKQRYMITDIVNFPQKENSSRLILGERTDMVITLAHGTKNESAKSY